MLLPTINYLRGIVYSTIGIWLFCSQSIIAQNSMGIGTNSPNQNAVLDLVSPTNDQGFLVPRVTTTQRTAMASGLNLSDNGMLIYDTDDGKFYYWINPSWFELSTVTVVPGSITDLEISAAAIKGAKIDPDFGAQDIITTGNITGFAFFGDGSGLTSVPATPGPSTVGSLELIDDDIFDVDVNAGAAIAGTKVSPNFGAQNILTTGNVDGNNITATGIFTGNGSGLTNLPAGPVTEPAVDNVVAGSSAGISLAGGGKSK